MQRIKRCHGEPISMEVSLMASLSQITDGHMTELKRILSGAGFGAEVAEEVLKHPEMALKMVNAILDPFQKALGLINGLFVHADQQMSNVISWSSTNGWGFAPRDIPSKMPAWPKQPLAALVLVPYWDDPVETAKNLWFAAASQQHRSYPRPGTELDWDVAFRDIVETAPRQVQKKCLRWEVIDFGASQGKGLYDRYPFSKPMPSAGVLAAAAHFPMWVRRMDGDRIPFVWVPGYGHLNTTSLLNRKGDLQYAKSLGDLVLPMIKWEYPAIKLTTGDPYRSKDAATPEFI